MMMGQSDEADGNHLDVETLREALAGRLAASAQPRVVRCLSVSWARCRSFLEGLDATSALAEPIRAGSGDPVAAALHRLLRVRPPSVAATSELERLRPAHRLALERIRDRPLGFAHLLLEEARELTILAPQDCVGPADQGRKLVLAAGLEAVDRARSRELEALALAYLGDAHRLASEPLEAEIWLSAAGEIVGAGGICDEIAATVIEMQAELLRSRRKLSQALKQLTKAEELLSDPVFGDRRAEILGKRGSLLLRIGDEPEALDVLERALALLPAARSPRLRLRLLHNLAATQVRLGNVERGLQSLELAAPLYTEHGYEFLRTQRLWVFGLAMMKIGQPEEAEKSLHNAVKQFLEQGYGRSAVRVLLDLGRLYVTAGWNLRFFELQVFFEDACRDLEMRSFLRSEIRELVQLARRKGLEVPYLQALLELLDAEGKPPVQ